MSVPAESVTEDSTATTEGEMQTKMSYAEWKKERKKQEKAERKRQKKSGATTSLSGLVFLGFFLMMIPLVGALLHVHIYGWQPNKSQDGSGGKLDIKFEGDVIEIVPDTLDEFLFHEGDSTSVAILFYAPWCQHCQRFKPDWQVIGGAYRKANHAKIAQVDCTTSEADCAMYEVDSYPTLLYWRDPSRNRHPQKWEGSKDVPTLMEWVRYGLGPYCTNEQQQHCSPKEQAILDKLLETSEMERKDKLEKAEHQIAETEAKFMEQVDQMSVEYDEIFEKVEAVRTKFTGKEWDLLRAIPNDEEEEDG